VQRFMRSPQREIYDQARQLMQEQHDNFTYVSVAEVEAIRAVLADSKPWQGNRLQQARPQLEALQLAIANQLASEQQASEQLLDELERRLCGAEGYELLSAERKAQLAAPFSAARQALKGQKLIAVLRDQRRRFEDERYPQLLLTLEQLARPQRVKPEHPEASPQPNKELTGGGDVPPGQPPQKVAEPRIVQARQIKVGYGKPWLTSETELDDYLQKQREAWLKEIQAGNRVQI